MKNFIKTAAESAVRVGKTGMLKMKKVSPTLMIAGGLVCIGFGVYEACRATHDDLDVIIDEHIDTVDEIKKEAEDTEASVHHTRTDITKQTIKTCWKLAKAYGKATGCLSVGIFLILASHGQMNKRLAGAIAYGEGVNQLFDDYRKRACKELGEEADRRFLSGVETVEVDRPVIDECGNQMLQKEKVDIFADYGNVSVVRRSFDSQQCPKNWRRDNFHNDQFVHDLKDWAEKKLNRDGYIFLNDILVEGGWERDGVGQVIGKVVNRDVDGKPVWTPIDISYAPFDDSVCNASGTPYRSYMLTFSDLKVIIYDI